MRYADGPTETVEIRIAASPERVWDLVSDITVPPRFSDELAETVWVEGAQGPGPGARFLGRNRHPAIGAWETVSMVAECVPGHCFAWDVQGPDGVAASWRFELEPDGAGTRLRQSGRMGPGRSGLSAAIEAMPDKEDKIVARRLGEWRRNMEATVEGIKALAEAG